MNSKYIKTNSKIKGCLNNFFQKNIFFFEGIVYVCTRKIAQAIS
jgi:hypothetical protein